MNLNGWNKCSETTIPTNEDIFIGWYNHYKKFDWCTGRLLNAYEYEINEEDLDDLFLNGKTNWIQYEDSGKAYFLKPGFWFMCNVTDIVRPIYDEIIYWRPTFKCPEE